MATLGGQIVLFGGTTVDRVDLGDVWTWNGSVWAEQAQGVLSPGARGGHAMATLGNNILLFGGGTPPDPCSDSPLWNVWQWDGTIWTKKDAPHWHSGHGMATVGGKIVLFGGQALTGMTSNDTWESDGEGWWQSAVTPYGQAMVAVGGKALIMGDGIWEWDGDTWTHLGPSSRPPFGDVIQGAFAARGDKVVLFGGFGSGGDGKYGFLTDTWEWDGTSWRLRPAQTSPPGRMGHAMAALGDKVVMFGGSSPDASGGFNFDPSHGGSDTWEWDGATWTKRTPPVSPPGRTGHAMVSVGDRIVLHGGQGADGPLKDTWQWNGSTWTRLTSPSSPAAGSGFALAPWNSTVVLFGGGAASPSDPSTFIPLHDTWILTGSTWTQLTPRTVC